MCIFNSLALQFWRICAQSSSICYHCWAESDRWLAMRPYCPRLRNVLARNWPNSISSNSSTPSMMKERAQQHSEQLSPWSRHGWRIPHRWIRNRMALDQNGVKQPSPMTLPFARCFPRPFERFVFVLSAWNLTSNEKKWFILYTIRFILIWQIEWYQTWPDLIRSDRDEAGLKL